MRAVLAVPGDLNMMTGGYIYDRRVLDELRKTGHDVKHLALPAGFPDPTKDDMNIAFDRLSAGSENDPLIIDGLAFGALDPVRVAQLKSPIIALIHHPLAKENGLNNNQKLALLETEKANLKHAAHVIVPSAHTAQILVNEYDVPQSAISIARPGSDRSTALPSVAHPPLILSVGIQMPRKGHDVLLKALARIYDLDWQAVIVGAPLDSFYAENLRQIRANLNLTKRVKLAGQVSDDTLAELYQSATVFALATRFEGYGIVFDEALVHGLPIVSCAVGAVPDTVPGGAGRLVAVDAPDAFGQALRDVLTDKNLRQSLVCASQTAGCALPGWDVTAAVFAQTLAKIK